VNMQTTPCNINCLLFWLARQDRLWHLANT
jgi:hypothetical protein